MASPKFIIPKKLDTYLRVLATKCGLENRILLQEIIVNASVHIEEAEGYDNWNGGMYGHGVLLGVPEDLFLAALDQKEHIEKDLCEKLNTLNSQENEWITRVSLEMADADEEDWRATSGVYRRLRVPVSISSESLGRIWIPGRLRVFLSHKSDIKVQASELKAAMLDYGLSAFVAHEDIEPDEAWQSEIERALFSMDALVALLTPGFHESDWTHQEVGVALGRGVPAISVRLGVDPCGLMGKKQALNGCSLESPERAAGKIYRVLHKRIIDRTKLADGVIHAYGHSNMYAQSARIVIEAMSVFETMTNSQVEAIQEAFRNNNQNYESFKSRNALVRLLKKWTGQNWQLSGTKLVAETASGDIPF